MPTYTDSTVSSSSWDGSRRRSDYHHSQPRHSYPSHHHHHHHKQQRQQQPQHRQSAAVVATRTALLPLPDDGSASNRVYASRYTSLSAQQQNHNLTAKLIWARTKAHTLLQRVLSTSGDRLHHHHWHPQQQQNQQRSSRVTMREPSRGRRRYREGEY